MAKKYDIDIRGCDVKVMSKLWFGPWHSILHGVYTMDGVLIGLFDTYSQVIDFVLKNQSKKPDVLCWYFWGCMKFMMFCHAHSDDIFDGIFKNTDIYREVKFLSAVIFDYDYTGFKSDEEDE